MYAVIVKSKEGWALVGNGWERVYYTHTWTIEDTLEEAEKVRDRVKGFIVPEEDRHLYCHRSVGKVI
tara:strand:+ start:304 stop:504 length:201 start_codon:yes stop_codon:yes gene_type:complete